MYLLPLYSYNWAIALGPPTGTRNLSKVFTFENLPATIDFKAAVDVISNLENVNCSTHFPPNLSEDLDTLSRSGYLVFRMRSTTQMWLVTPAMFRYLFIHIRRYVLRRADWNQPSSDQA
jgi:hypothetical protein